MPLFPMQSGRANACVFYTTIAAKGQWKSCVQACLGLKFLYLPPSLLNPYHKPMIASTRINDLQQCIATSGDMQAYKELYTFFFSRLYRFSYAIVRSREAAEEVVSDVFIKIWQIKEELATINNLQVYLYTLTKNFSLNYIAKYHKAPVVCLDEIDVEAMVTRNNPEDILISMDLCDRINEAIRALPSQCRLIFQLVKEDGLRYKEVASVLNISVFTVRNQVAIATKKIAEAIPAHLSSSNAVKGLFSAS